MVGWLFMGLGWFCLDVNGHIVLPTEGVVKRMARSEAEGLKCNNPFGRTALPGGTGVGQAAKASGILGGVGGRTTIPSYARCGVS